jgi:hypothetical protein
LTDEDVSELFRKLVKTSGSVSRAAERCGLERRTVYLWSKKGDLRAPTKRKVLRTLLDEAPEETLSYMSKRCRQTAAYLLSTYQRTLFENALEPKLPLDEFNRLVAMFDEARRQNAGMIVDEGMEEGIASMQFSLRRQASERRVSYEPEPPEVITLGGLTNIMPSLMAEIHRQSPDTDTTQLSKEFNLPVRFVSTISRCLAELLASDGRS